MTTVGDRLKYIIEQQGVSIRKFCETHELNYTNMTMVIKNDRPLGMNVLHQVKAAIPQLDAEWLLYGTDRDNVPKNDNIKFLPQTAEPESEYLKSDPFEKLLLTYLDSPSIQDKIKSILNDPIQLLKRDAFEAACESPGFITKLDEIHAEDPKLFKKIIDQVEQWNKEDQEAN